MKKLNFIEILLIIVYNVNCQSIFHNDSSVIVNCTEASVLKVGDAEFKGIKVKFYKPFEGIAYSKINNMAVVSFKSSGLKKYIVGLDLLNGKVKWQYHLPVSYYKNFDSLTFVELKTGLIAQPENYVLDVNGKIRWHNKNDYFIYYPQTPYAITFSPYSKFFCVFNPSTGKDFYYKQLNKKENFSGINDIIFPDSSALLIQDGIHKISKTGEHWYYPLKNTEEGKTFRLGGYSIRTKGVFIGSKNVDKDILENTLGTIYGLSSNIIKDGDELYVTDLNYLVCLNYNTGHELWKKKLPRDYNGRVVLDFNDKYIFISSTGLAEKFNKNSHDLFFDYCKTYFAVYDRKSGEKIFYNKFDDEDGSLYQVQETNKIIYLCFKDKIVAIDKETFIISKIVGLFEHKKVYGDIPSMFSFNNDDYNNIPSTFNNDITLLNLINKSNKICDLATYRILNNEKSILVPVNKGLIIIYDSTSQIEFFPFGKLGQILYENSNYYIVAPLWDKMMDWSALSYLIELHFVNSSTRERIDILKLDKFDYYWYYSIMNNQFTVLLKDALLVYKLE